MNTEIVILSHLINSEQFSRKVVPYVKTEYFAHKPHKIIYELFADFLHKYNTVPTKESLLIELADKSGLSQELFNDAKNSIIDLASEQDTNVDWLTDKTEEWCKERAIHNAIIESIKIIDGKSNLDKGSLEKIMRDALAVSFDSSVGHDFIEDADSRFEFYHTKEKRIPFDLGMMNTITDGGLPNKTLNLILAVTGGGKSRFMCHAAANNLRDGLNVLYITLEMAEERIAERIDANLLDIPINELRSIPKESYDGKMARLRKTTKGKLILKEYPTAGAGANHFRFLFNELILKKNFKPDIVYIDYINICTSSRLKMGANVNTYSYIKSIAEELRGLAVEFDIPIVTATQINRSGFGNSDIEMENVSESIGLPATVDFMVALINNEELAALDQVLVKQLKNRYTDVTTNSRFCIGIDRLKMRHYDLEDPKADLMPDTPVMDATEFGKRESNIRNFEDFR